jgi:hypothetical protein
MKTNPSRLASHTSRLAAILFVGPLMIAATPLCAQSDQRFHQPLTLAPADAAAGGGDDEPAKAAELAMKLANPVADLISVPFQNNFDWGAGPSGDGFPYKLNLQPVIPIRLNEDWNLISRTILPYVYQEDVIGTSSQSGLSDTEQSLFFSPQKRTSGGWI